MSDKYEQMRNAAKDVLVQNMRDASKVLMDARNVFHKKTDELAQIEANSPEWRAAIDDYLAGQDAINAAYAGFTAAAKLLVDFERATMGKSPSDTAAVAAIAAVAAGTSEETSRTYDYTAGCSKAILDATPADGFTITNAGIEVDLEIETQSIRQHAVSHMLDSIWKANRIQRELQGVAAEDDDESSASEFIIDRINMADACALEDPKGFADALVSRRNGTIQKRAKFIAWKNEVIIAGARKALLDHFSESTRPYEWRLEEYSHLFDCDQDFGDHQGMHSLAEYSALITQLREALSDPRIEMSMDSLRGPTKDDYWEYVFEIALKDA
jgi:hypothetical protein